MNRLFAKDVAGADRAPAVDAPCWSGGERRGNEAGELEFELEQSCRERVCLAWIGMSDGAFAQERSLSPDSWMPPRNPVLPKL